MSPTAPSRVPSSTLGLRAFDDALALAFADAARPTAAAARLRSSRPSSPLETVPCARTRRRARPPCVVARAEPRSTVAFARPPPSPRAARSTPRARVVPVLVVVAVADDDDRIAARAETADIASARRRARVAACGRTARRAAGRLRARRLVACAMPDGSVCRPARVVRARARHRVAPSTSLLDASRTMAKMRVRGARVVKRAMRKRWRARASRGARGGRRATRDAKASDGAIAAKPYERGRDDGTTRARWDARADVARAAARARGKNFMVALRAIEALDERSTDEKTRE